MKKVIRDHSLSIILISIFLVQSVIGGYLYHNTWKSDQENHGQSSSDLGAFWNDYFGEYTISVLADAYGAVLLVILTKKLYEKGSAESKK